MTTERKPNASSQPSFAEFMREFAAKFRSGNSVPIERSSITRTEYDRFLSAIREQQAALEFYAEDIRYRGANQPPFDGDKYTRPGAPYLQDIHRDNGDNARAVLARWRIE